LEILIQEKEGSYDWHVRQGLDVVVKPLSTSNCAYAEWPQFLMNQANNFPNGSVVTRVAPPCCCEIRLAGIGNAVEHQKTSSNWAEFQKEQVEPISAGKRDLIDGI